jgi:hypothetical protein
MARARAGWVRVFAAGGGMTPYPPPEVNNLPKKVEWPALSMDEVMRLAFKDRRLDSLQDELLKKLRGEVQ